MHKKIIISCLVVALAGGTAAALDLAEALARARANHPAWRAARAQIDAATGRVQQAPLWPNPELEFSVEDLPADDGGLSQSKLLVGLTQTVPFPGKTSLDARIARQDLTAAEQHYRARDRELVREVTVAFYRAVAAHKKTAVAHELVALAQAIADATRQRVATGAAAAPELLRAEIELERARAETAATRRDLTESLRTLSRWVGQPVATVTGDLPEHVTPPAALAAEHPQRAAALAQQRRAELELRRARLDPWPDITLGVAAGRDRATDETMMEFRVSLPLPLFDRAQGRKREARALAEIARLEAEDTAQQLAQEWDIAVARLEAAQTQADAYRTRILPKAEEALRLVRQGYEAGKFSLLDLLDTQRTAFETRLAYYDILLELNTAAAELAALSSEELP